MSLRSRRTVFQLTPLLDLLLIIIFLRNIWKSDKLRKTGGMVRQRSTTNPTRSDLDG